VLAVLRDSDSLTMGEMGRLMKGILSSTVTLVSADTSRNDTSTYACWSMDIRKLFR